MIDLMIVVFSEETVFAVVVAETVAAVFVPGVAVVVVAAVAAAQGVVFADFAVQVESV